MLRQRTILMLACALATSVCSPAMAVQLLIIQNTNLPGDSGERLVSYAPADREALAQSPAAITLTFSVAVRPDRSSIQVFDPYGMQVNDGAVTVNGLAMSAAMPQLNPGNYRVKWQAECACPDRTQLQDIYHFSVR